MTTVCRTRTLLLALLACGALGAQGADWPNWRGPALNGSTADTGFLQTWGADSGIKWSAPLPGFSGATPCVVGENVFVSSPDSNKNLLLLCLDRKDGKVRWQKELGTGDQTKGRTSPNMTSPSPISDGKSVYVLYGTGDLAALDLNGKVLWQRNLGTDHGRFSIMWLYGCSPALYRGKLYIQVLQRSPVPGDYTHAMDGNKERESYLLAIDAATGKDLWKHVRTTDAKLESMESYSTPIPYEHDGKAEILVFGGDYLTGHDPDTGAELWRCGGFNPKKGEWMRVVTSPVTWKDMIYAVGPKKVPLSAIKAGGKGDITATHVAWQFSDAPPDVCTPVVYQDKLFVLDGDKQSLTCLDPKTGNKIWSGSLGVRENFKASPTAAEGRIYCVSERGTVVICDAGPEFKVLSTIELGGGEPSRSSIVASQGQLFIRLAEKLLCVGK